MSAVADFADVKRRWEDEVPDEVDIRLVDIWCPATVVGYNQRKTLFDCRLQKDIRVTMGPKGFLGRRPNTIIYKKEEIVPNVTVRSIRRRIQADPLNPEGEQTKMSTRRQRPPCSGRAVNLLAAIAPEEANRAGVCPGREPSRNLYPRSFCQRALTPAVQLLSKRAYPALFFYALH